MEFDPKNRSKVFRKKVRVITNAKQKEVVLRVQGFIIPDPTVLRKRLGQLRLNRAEFNFGNVLDTEVKYDSIVIRNESNHKMELGFDLTDKPDNIDVTVDDSIIAPGEISMIRGIIRGVKEGEYGFQRFRLKFFDKAYPDSTRGQLIVSYNQQEDFESWSKEKKANAPRIKFTSKVCNFGKKKQGDEIECRYEFKNIGKDILRIRDIRLPSHVREGDFKREINPGEKGEIILLADTSRMSGELIRYIHVTTNCPSSSRVRLEIRGKVIDKN